MKTVTRFGLAVLAALALSVVAGASSAGASGFETDSYPATIKGSPTDEEFFLLGGLSAICGGQTLGIGGIDYPVGSFEASPSDTTCTNFGSGHPLEMDGCELTLQPGTETAPGKFTGTIAIGPSGCGPITLTVKTRCISKIGAQSGLKATYENIGKGSTATIAVKLETDELTFTNTHLGGGASCKDGTFSNGSWDAAWSLSASDGGSQVGIRAASKLPTLIGVHGEESEVEAEQPRFEAANYPVALSGSQDLAQPHTFGFKAGKASCENATFGSEVFGPTTELSVDAAYTGGCITLGFAGGSISMNGCGYAFHILNAGPPYAGEADIVCPEGKAIVIVSKLFGINKCTITIPAQTGIGGMGFQNYEWGMVVNANLSLTGIQYHQQEGSGIGRCVGTGNFSDGTYTGVIPFQGLS